MNAHDSGSRPRRPATGCRSRQRIATEPGFLYWMLDD